MEQYKKILKTRNLILYVLIFISICSIIVLSELSNKGILKGILYDSRNISSLTESFQKVVYFAWLIWIIVKIRKNKKIIKDNELLKIILIEEKDERSNYIKGKIGNIGFNVSICVLTIAAFIIGFVNKNSFYTLLITLLVMVSIRIIIKIYYSHKY